MNEPEVAISAALGAWLALRRLDRGRVTLIGEVLFDGGRPVPGYLATPFRRLLDHGHARMDGPCVHNTEAGRDLYRELGRVRGLWLATERTVPFGLTAAHLLSDNERDE